RQQRAAGTKTVARHVAHVAADRVQEAVYLALRVVKASGTAPAVGAAEDRFVSVRGFHPFQLRSREIERLVPCHLDERFGAASFGASTGPALEPAFANGRPQYSGGRCEGRGHRVADRRWIGIVGEGLEGGYASGLDFDLIHAPMGGGEQRC